MDTEPLFQLFHYIIPLTPLIPLIPLILLISLAPVINRQLNFLFRLHANKMVATCHIVAKHVNTLSWISGSKIGRVGSCRGSPDSWHIVALALVAEALTHCRVGTCRGSPDTLSLCHLSRKPWHIVALALVAEALTHCCVGTCRWSPDTLTLCHLSLSCSEK